MPSAKDNRYDLIVIGSGPGGQRAAVQAAKLKKRVLVVEKERVGGACLHKATIPSKTLREAALDVAKPMASLPEAHVRNPWQAMQQRMRRVIDAETELLGEQLGRNAIAYLQGTGQFVDAHTVRVDTAQGAVTARAEHVVIATGTSPNRPAHIGFNGTTLLDSDTILAIQHQPSTLAVVGAGVIGCEYASIFARMGTRVTLINRPDTILRGVDGEIVTALLSHFAEKGIEVRKGCEFDDRPLQRDGRVGLRLDGKECFFDAILWCLGRKGNIAGLGLDAAGITPNERGLIPVNEHYQTVVGHIYAVGDVIGLPGLAAASAEQGRLAAAHAFGLVGGKFPTSFPYGIYTIPEISWAGKQEEELTDAKVPFVVGRAQYTELARGKILGEDHGFLKLLVHKETRKILGVHVLGSSATELVHIGQIAMDLGASVEFFVNNVFNYPTLAEAYKVAAYNAWNQICLVKS